jgi:hypothetical protein
VRCPVLSGQSGGTPADVFMAIRDRLVCSVLR